jgi:hypothetical protein
MVAAMLLVLMLMLEDPAEPATAAPGAQLAAGTPEVTCGQPTELRLSSACSAHT